MEELLRIWVDADSCPKAVRQFLLRAAKRLNTEPPKSLDSRDKSEETGTLPVPTYPFHFVAAKELPIETDLDRQLHIHRVAPGTDACDRFIQERCQKGDIVITRDIVFAEILCREVPGLCIINDRGTEYTAENVSARRRWRDLALELRRNDLLAESPASRNYSAKALKQFAACFDRCLYAQQQKYCMKEKV